MDWRNAMFSTASKIRDMTDVQSRSPGGTRIPEPSRASSPIGRRHRRSYTISAPLGVRVNPFPSPAPGPRSQTPSRKTFQTLGKENISPVTLPSTTYQEQPKSIGKARFSASESALVKPSAKELPTPAEQPAPSRRPRIFHTTSIFNDRFLDLPPLPEAWTQQHDRAICVLDSRNYSHSAIVSKLRRVFPELKGTLTPLMIDKRLRILDQDVEVDYWRIGVRAQSAMRGHWLPRRNAEELDSQATLTHRTPTPKSKNPMSLFKPSPRGQSSPASTSRTVTRTFGSGFKSYLDRL